MAMGRASRSKSAARKAKDLEKLRAELQRSVSLTAVRTEQVLWRGVIPHPDDFARFEQIQPGAADRILALAEGQAAHRRQMEWTALNDGDAQAKLGIVVVGVPFLASLIVCWDLVKEGQSPEGIGLILSEVVALAGAFGYAHRSGRRELRRKDPTNVEKPRSEQLALGSS